MVRYTRMTVQKNKSRLAIAKELLKMQDKSIAQLEHLLTQYKAFRDTLVEIIASLEEEIVKRS